jgi:hypothetical protein
MFFLEIALENPAHCKGCPLLDREELLEQGCFVHYCIYAQAQFNNQGEYDDEAASCEHGLDGEIYRRRDCPIRELGKKGAQS